MQSAIADAQSRVDRCDCGFRVAPGVDRHRDAPSSCGAGAIGCLETEARPQAASGAVAAPAADTASPPLPIRATAGAGCRLRGPVWPALLIAGGDREKAHENDDAGVGRGGGRRGPHAVRRDARGRGVQGPQRDDAKRATGALPQRADAHSQIRRQRQQSQQGHLQLRQEEHVHQLREEGHRVQLRGQEQNRDGCAEPAQPARCTRRPPATPSSRAASGCRRTYGPSSPSRMRPV